jgi:hypothetical protein
MVHTDAGKKHVNWPADRRIGVSCVQYHVRNRTVRRVMFRPARPVVVVRAICLGGYSHYQLHYQFTSGWRAPLHVRVNDLRLFHGGYFELKVSGTTLLGCQLII